jgi:hypothetical protein
LWVWGFGGLEHEDGLGFEWIWNFLIGYEILQDMKKLGMGRFEKLDLC